MSSKHNLGGFTLFITMSAAETRWPELLKILKYTVDGEQDADVSNMQFREKARLIQKDPVTCARYFQHRLNCVMKTWSKTKEGPFQNYIMVDYFYRIEFQHRGSPHVHMLVWLGNAPKFDSENVDSYDDVTRFIDKIISCSSQIEGLSDLMYLQTHRCTHTCYKNQNTKTGCRFDAPFKPIDKTTILMPMTKEEKDKLTENQKVLIRNRNRSIKELLDKLPDDIETFEDFLKRLKISREDYIEALSAVLTKPKILLKRTPKDNRINPFSPKILSLMRSNMDIQFALDIYACIGYIVDYINKSSRGLSKILREAVEQVKKGNNSVRQNFKTLGNAFMNATEISAQEGAWVCLSQPLCKSSRKVEHVNTNRIEKRTKLVKSAAVLAKLDKDSTDIYITGAFERYAIRPVKGILKDICLADFLAEFEYQVIKTKKQAKNFKETLSDESEKDDDRDVNESDEEKLEDTIVQQGNDDLLLRDPLDLTKVLGKFRRRRQPKILKFKLVNVEVDPDNYFRQIMLLFYPHRDEKEDVENQNCQELYMLPSRRPIIEANMKKYCAFDVNLDLDALIKEIEEFREMEKQMEDEEETAGDDQDYANPFGADAGERVANIMVDIGMEASSDFSIKKFTVPKMMSDEKYNSLITHLNEKQLDYLMHVLNAFRNKRDRLPFYHFISGSAGVGKTFLINSIDQTIRRECEKQRGPQEITTLLLAPTGKAAHNINGMTLHHAFSLPVTQNVNQNTLLSPDIANTLAVKYNQLQLIIIDEISMVGSKCFNLINRRLQQIFRSLDLFANIPIICLGDFNQLPVSC